MKITRAVTQENIGTLAGIPVVVERPMTEDDAVVQPMKSLGALLTTPRQPTEDPRDPTAFAHWVRLTSELIGRSYIQTAKLVEDWPLHKIERRWKEAMDCGPNITPAIKWWWLRKKERMPAETGATGRHARR